MATTIDNTTNHPPDDPNLMTTQQDHEADPSSTPNLPHQPYPKWIGSKFNPDGTVLPFPGNTILCHLPPTSNLYTNLLNLYGDLQKQPFAQSYVLLPPSSWHMTLSEGVCDQIRNPGSWPSEVPLDTPLQSCTEYMRHKLETFELGCDPPFQMMITGWQPLEDGIALTLKPATKEEEIRLRDLRHRLAEHLGLRHPGYDEYVFHVSLAYTLRFLTQQEIETTLEFLEGWRRSLEGRLEGGFEVGRPEFCGLGDMFAFERVVELE